MVKPRHIGHIHVVMTLFLLSVSAFSIGLSLPKLARTSSGGVAVPAGILYYFPVTLTNSQSSATSTPFQQMITVDSVTYSAYEASNLQNVEFFDANGNIIPSWLESGDNNTATSTVYWLSLASKISASSSIIIYIGFASTSTNLFNTVSTGEAPQLSPSYGQYDDGANVFSAYWNFAGTSLPSQWIATVSPKASFTVNNGLIFTTPGIYGDGINFTTSPNYNPQSILSEFYMQSNCLSACASVAVGNGFDFGFGISPEKTVVISTTTSGDYSLHPGAAFVFDDLMPVTPLNTNWHVLSIYTTSTTACGILDYTVAQICTSSGYTSASSAGLYMGGAGVNPQTSHVDWTRVRSQPPNGVMPSVHAATPSLKSVAYDESGIPLVYYGATWGWQYNPVTVAQSLMKHYASYKQTGNQTDLALLVNESNWLVSNSELEGNYSMLYYHFDFPLYNLTNPWRSGMAQGQALQALTEATQATGNRTYLATAKLLLNSLYVSEANGGVTDKTPNQGWWYEEYADDHGANPRVLNGMMFTLVGVYEYYQYTNDSSAEYLFDQGITSLSINLPRYDSPQYGSYYDVLGHPANDKYMLIHITLLSQLYNITGVPIFKEYHDKWNAWYVAHISGAPGVSQPIELSVAKPALPTTVKLSGCSVSPTSIPADGKAHTVTAAAGCTIAVHLPSTNTTRYSAAESTAASTVYTPTLSIKTCSSGTCSTYSHTIYEQFYVTFKSSPSTKGTTTPSGSEWYQAGLTITIKATPKSGHHFSKWTSSTSLIEIANTTSATTTATIGGAGTITATLPNNRPFRFEAL